MEAAPAVVLLLFLSNPSAVLGAGSSLYRPESGQFVNAPSETVETASRFACSARCTTKWPLGCSGFTYSTNGTCDLFSGEGNCRGPAARPDNGQPPSQRWSRSACPGNISDLCGCPEGFTRCAGRCLKRIPQQAHHSVAETLCGELGAHLAVPRSEQENQCAITLAIGDDVWLGITDTVTEGEFIGADGCGPVQIPDAWWAAFQPNNWGIVGNADCVYMVSSTKWDDWHCATNSFPLCQLPMCHRPECP